MTEIVSTLERTEVRNYIVSSIISVTWAKGKINSITVAINVSRIVHVLAFLTYSFLSRLDRSTLRKVLHNIAAIIMRDPIPFLISCPTLLQMSVEMLPDSQSNTRPSNNVRSRTEISLKCATMLKNVSENQFEPHASTSQRCHKWSTNF